VTAGNSEGNGVPVFDLGNSTASTLQFRSLFAGSNITLTQDLPIAGDITIAAASGGSGLPGYAYVASQQTITVPASGIVTFNQTAAPSANIGVTSTILTVSVTGVYSYDFGVVGTPGFLVPPPALAFGLSINGGLPAATDEFYGDVQTVSLAAADTLSVYGSGIISLSATNTVSLMNRTMSTAASGPVSVGLTSIPQAGGEAGISAWLRLFRIA
jgi:hypothetical protein